MGNGTSVSIQVDGVLMDMAVNSISPGGSANAAQDLEIGGVTVTGLDRHIGEIDFIKIKNDANQEIINYQFTERQGLNISNEGADAPVSSGLVFNLLPDYSDNINYGFITVTSPNAKTVSGWLMKIKRNPVNRIAKVELLEKA